MRNFLLLVHCNDDDDSTLDIFLAGKLEPQFRSTSWIYTISELAHDSNKALSLVIIQSFAPRSRLSIIQIHFLLRLKNQYAMKLSTWVFFSTSISFRYRCFTCSDVVDIYGKTLVARTRSMLEFFIFFYWFSLLLSTDPPLSTNQLLKLQGTARRAAPINFTFSSSLSTPGHTLSCSHSVVKLINHLPDIVRWFTGLGERKARPERRRRRNPS